MSVRPGRDFRWNYAYEMERHVIMNNCLDCSLYSEDAEGNGNCELGLLTMIYLEEEIPEWDDINGTIKCERANHVASPLD